MDAGNEKLHKSEGDCPGGVYRLPVFERERESPYKLHFSTKNLSVAAGLKRRLEAFFNAGRYNIDLVDGQNDAT